MQSSLKDQYGFPDASGSAAENCVKVTVVIGAIYCTQEGRGTLLYDVIRMFWSDLLVQASTVWGTP